MHFEKDYSFEFGIKIIGKKILLRQDCVLRPGNEETVSLMKKLNEDQGFWNIFYLVLLNFVYVLTI